VSGIGIGLSSDVYTDLLEISLAMRKLTAVPRDTLPAREVEAELRLVAVGRLDILDLLRRRLRRANLRLTMGELTRRLPDAVPTLEVLAELGFAVRLSLVRELAYLTLTVGEAAALAQLTGTTSEMAAHLVLDLLPWWLP